MSRAALLPFPGDPFLLSYWLRSFMVWQREVDRLYIYFNSPIEQPAADYILSMCSVLYPKVKVVHHREQVEHGEAINRMLDIVEEEYIMLIEDDTFIFKSGEVDKCFQLIESGTVDAVGSKRGSCGQEIWDEAARVYGLDYSGYGDQGPNFWPSLFFIHKSHLLATDRNFAARSWKRGERIQSLHDYVVQAEVCPADTFVNTSLQLRAKGLQFHYIPQYHGSPYDADDYNNRQNLWDGKAPWVHVGSLSSGVGGLLQDGHGRCLARRMIDPPKEVTALPNAPQTDQERKEYERRVQWWLLFWQSAPDISSDIKEFYDLYGQAIYRIIGDFGLNEGRIRQVQMMYKEIINL